MRKLIVKHLVIFLVSLSLFAPGLSFALVAPTTYTGAVNTSIGSVLTSKLGKTAALGAEYDAKFQRTMGGITSGLTATATTLVAGGAAVAVGAISWPALLISAGISGVVSGALSIGVDSLVKWMWPDSSNPGKIQVTLPTTADPSTLPLNPNDYQVILNSFGTNADLWFRNGNGTAVHYRTVAITCPTHPLCYNNFYGYNSVNESFTGQFTGNANNGLYFAYGWGRGIWNTAQTQVTLEAVYQFLPAPGVPLLPPAFTPYWTTPALAVQSIPQADAAKPLTNEQLAAIVNAAWKNAPATTADTYIYNEASKVTAQDVADWRAANPGVVPTLQDLTGPVAPTGTSDVPLPAPPVTATAPDPAASSPTPPASSTTPGSTIGGIDFGVPANNDSIPRSEASVTYTPTIFASATGCPEPLSFVMFGKTYQITYTPMCNLMTTLSSIFLAMGAAAAALIFAEGFKA